MKKSYLSILNPEQLQAVEKIFGTVLVIAGPGTGKTQMLTARIANILDKTDTNPENILCLTFTESGAVEMRNRLQRWIGSEAYKVKICTFHSFCEEIMQEEDIEKNIADDLQKAISFRKVIDKKHWKYLKPFGDNYYWQKSFLSTVSHLKRENVSIEKLRGDLIPKEKEHLEADPGNFYQRDCKYGKKGEMKTTSRVKVDIKIAKMFEFTEVWEAYEKELHRQRLYDFDDQISRVVAKITTDQGLKSDLQEKYQFILVDEYQDTNSAQNQILWHLTDFFDDPNLFSVGDDDQSIYRFQGASLENILEFRQHFPSAETISLTKNYRSAQNILDSAFTAVSHNLERIDSEKSLKAVGDNRNFEGEIEKAVFHSRFPELIFLAEKIRDEIKSGVSPSDIAVLVRNNKEVKEIAAHLQKFKIPVATKIAENVFEDGNVKYLIRMLRVFDNPTLDHVFFELLHAPFLNISSHELFELSIATKNGRNHIANIQNSKFKIQNSKNKQEEMQFSGIQKIFQVFLDGQKEYYHLLPYLIAEKLFHASGMARYLLREENSNRVSDLLKIRKFIEWVEMHDVPLRDILEKIDLHHELEIPLFPDPTPSDNQSVQVMTAHKSKGMEFDVVFISGLLDRVWGNLRKKTGIPLPYLFETHHDQNEDERRLFFVAMTRAKKKVILSYAEKDFSGRDRSPSIFWHEIPEKNCNILDTQTLHSKAQELFPVFFSAPSTPLLTGEEKDILKKIVDNFVWSATSLQNYLDCPKKFLYLNILKIPTPKSKIMGFGIAIHKALQDLLEKFKEDGKLPGKEFLFQQFDLVIRRQNLNLAELENALHHGRELLELYYKTNESSFSKNVLLEYDFPCLHPKILGIPVTGKIDKIELSEDGKQAVFVDYKSGKPRKIESGERLWRQLVFYDLLARNSKSVDWEVQNFVLEFLTPDSKGNFIRKDLTITDEDRSQVIEELKLANEELRNLEFPMVENPENDKEIEYWQSF